MTRWIGDALVIDDAALAAARWTRALWCAPSSSEPPQLARVRAIDVTDVGDVDADGREQAAFATAAFGPVARGRGIIPVHAICMNGSRVARIEADVGDVTLRELIDVTAAQGETPAGLVLAVARAVVRAWQSCDELDDSAAFIGATPRTIALGWDGSIWCRGAPLFSIAEEELAADALTVVTHAATGGSRERNLGILLYELAAGTNPYSVAGDDSVAMAGGRAQAEAHAPLPERVSPEVRALVERLLAPREMRFASWAAFVRHIDGLRDREAERSGPFEERELAGMLRHLFPERARVCAIEREDRLHTALPLRAGPTWEVL